MFYSILKKIFTSSLLLFLVFGLVFSFTAGVGSATVTIRNIDGGLGLLNTPLTTSQKEHRQSLSKSMMSGGVDTEAFISGSTLGAILQAVWRSLQATLLTLIRGIIYTILNFIRENVMDFVNRVLAFIDDFIDILEKLAEILSATRVGVGFIVYRSMQSDTNILPSRSFALDLIRQTDERMAGFERFIGERGENVIIDAVTWLDFMTVQKELQADTIGIQGLIENSINSLNINIMGYSLNINLDNYNDVRNRLMFVLAGVSCNNSAVVNALGPFSATLRDNSSCYEEVRATMSGVLNQRERQLRGLARAKTATLEDRAPANCRLRSSISYTGSGSFNFSAGNLDAEILQIAREVELITPTPEDCELATTGSQQKRDVVQNKAIESAIIISGTGSATGESNDFLGNVLKDIFDYFLEELEGMFTQIMEDIESRFNKIGELLDAILNGGNIGLQIIFFNISVGTGNQIKNRLNTLSRDIQRQLSTEGNFGGSNDMSDSFERFQEEILDIPLDIPVIG